MGKETERIAGGIVRRQDFDVIRVIAMVCIVFFHLNLALIDRGCTSPLIIRWAGNNLSMGQQGVVLFILLSGAASCGSYERSLKKEKSIKKAVLSYYKKRFRSLMPMLWIAWFASYILVLAPAIPGKGIVFTLIGFDGYLTMSGYTTYYLTGEWFMGMIILCYLVFPILYFLIRKWPVRTLLGLLVYFVLTINFSPLNELTRQRDSWFSFRVFDFAMGMYLGIYVKKWDWRAAAASLVIFLFSWCVHFSIDNMYAISIQGISSFVLIGYGIQTLGKVRLTAVKKVLNGLCRAAKYSYAVFLVHHVLIMQLTKSLAAGDFGVRHYIKESGYLIVIICISAVLLYGAEKYVMSFFAPKKQA